MKFCIHANGNIRHEAILKKHIEKRIPAEFGSEGLKIDLRMAETLKTPESYRISRRNGIYIIEGADERGLYYGIGKFLRTSVWSEDSMIPNPPKSVFSPDSAFRAIYFAVHFSNWYQNAPNEELETYVEELLLYGYNTIVLILPVVQVSSMEDRVMRDVVDHDRFLFRHAHGIGMKTGLIFCANQGFMNMPHRLDADLSYDSDGTHRGWLGRNVCISKEGGIPYMHAVWRGQLKQFSDIGIDTVIVWPYDEGGCNCEKCRPWGANGYLRAAKALSQDVKEFYPNAEFILSTWLYDYPDDEGEFAGLYSELRSGYEFIDAIMCDSHTDFPSYPLTHEPVRPIVSFPEISMWKLFPWGGYGANPMPERFETLFRQSKSAVSGGMPYSEGCYEDALKVQEIGYFWNQNASYRETLSEYAEYEFGAGTGEDAVRLMELIGRNHCRVGTGIGPDYGDALEAKSIAEKIDRTLTEKRKRSWRWRILYIRAILDEKRYALYADHHLTEENLTWLRKYASVELDRDSEALALLRELFDLYHAEAFNGNNRGTLPVIDGDLHLEKPIVSPIREPV